MKYTEDHEWLSIDGDIAAIGITNYAQDLIGDIVFVELPKIGAVFRKGDVAAAVESVKAASEVFAPVTGEITAVNDALSGEPGLVNSDPTGAGWFFKMRLTEPGELDALLDEAGYNALIA